jgi:uncharacterized cupredoxin-like copper-binding protein
MTRTRTLLAALAIAVLGLAVAPLASAHRQHPGATTVTVKEKEFAFILSTKTVRKGTVTFKLVNVGKLAHDFKINGKKAALLPPGKTSTFLVKFTKAGKFPYICTVPGHAAAGMKGTLTVK